VNWDVLRAQNLHRVEENQSGRELRRWEYIDRADGRQPTLEFIHEYGLLPFCRFPVGLPSVNPSWAWAPGYHVWNIIQKSVIAVTVNSSRWGVDHVEQLGLVEQRIWRAIRDQLNGLDPDRRAMRILIVHHSLDYHADPDERLR